MEIPRYKSVSGVAYLEASAIRCYAAQFNYIFSGVLYPRVCRRNRATCDNFQLSFRKHSPDRRILRECRGLPPVLTHTICRWIENKIARQYKYGSSTPGKMETTLATRRRGLFGQPCDATCGRAVETKRDAPKSTNSINTPH